MITTRDIKVFIFSVLFSIVCYALFNQSIKEAEAQGGKGARGLASVAPQEIYDPLQAHITGAIANHTQTRDLLQAHIRVLSQTTPLLRTESKHISRVLSQTTPLLRTESKHISRVLSQSTLKC